MGSLAIPHVHVAKCKSFISEAVKHSSLHYITFLLGEFMQFSL